ncbi:hypothetical protein LWI28_002527 [Acer negundo]|uniref:Uncharacterized protein n=1 Tax=Acer negundo TaxID=4023 RepID=A0AAD5JF44_ACENE|nr:hypothetical protein LWI28_002527 [Acer negundo]
MSFAAAVNFQNYVLITKKLRCLANRRTRTGGQKIVGCIGYGVGCLKWDDEAHSVCDDEMVAGQYAWARGCDPFDEPCSSPCFRILPITIGKGF